MYGEKVLLNYYLYSWFQASSTVYLYMKHALFWILRCVKSQKGQMCRYVIVIIIIIIIIIIIKYSYLYGKFQNQGVQFQ
jgi:hypothetical protein